jgi:uncharacterized protein YjbI with pentapeptide repeats
VPVPQPARELDDLPYAAALRPHRGGLAADGEYDAAHFDQIALEEADARNAVFLECAFSRVTVQGGSLRQARFSDVWLRDARLMSADLVRSSWLDATFIDAVVAGVEAFGSTLRRVTFCGCKLDSVNFRDAKLTDVRFENCLLRAVDFGGATLARTVFAESQLKKVDFSKTSMDQVDLRGSELDIVAGPDSLRGAVIDSGQLAGIARALAEGLGIVVTDD